jgi:hypothetical protein
MEKDIGCVLVTPGLDGKTSTSPAMLVISLSLNELQSTGGSHNFTDAMSSLTSTQILNMKQT